MIFHIDGLVQERRNSTANALELRLSCTNPSIWYQSHPVGFKAMGRLHNTNYSGLCRTASRVESWPSCSRKRCSQLDGILPKWPFYAWRVGPFWQDTIELWLENTMDSAAPMYRCYDKNMNTLNFVQSIFKSHIIRMVYCKFYNADILKMQNIYLSSFPNTLIQHLLT